MVTGDKVIAHFPDSTVACGKETSCKMSAKHLRLSWRRISSPPAPPTNPLAPQWTKQPNILLLIVKEWIRLLQCWLWPKKEGPSFTHNAPEREELERMVPPPHFLACLVTMLRGGVTGRLPLGFFFSAGLRICNRERNSVGGGGGAGERGHSFPQADSLMTPVSTGRHGNQCSSSHWTPTVAVTNPHRSSSK